MSTDDLFDALSSLASDRRLPKEIDAVLAPFRDKNYALSLIFTSASRKFVNPLPETDISLQGNPENRKADKQ